MNENEIQRMNERVVEVDLEKEMKESYLAYMDSLNTSGDRIEYIGENAANIRL